jgi:two-component system, OmpR family, response regulator
MILTTEDDDNRVSAGLREPTSRGERRTTGAQSATDADFARSKILCVDDDREISKIWKLRLERFGIEVVRAFNGRQAYSMALESRPDLIMLDMQLPDEDGACLLERLRLHPRTARVPVLILTGSDTPAMRQQIVELGVVGCLTKPVDFTELVALIGHYLPLSDPHVSDHQKSDK